MDLADLADRQIEAQLQAALARHRQPRLSAVHLHCRQCGTEIPRQRRDLVPHTSNCVACATARELELGMRSCSSW